MAKAKSTPTIRRWTAEDIPGIVACHRAAYPEYDDDSSHYDERIYSMQFQAFPEGQALIEIGGFDCSLRRLEDLDLFLRFGLWGDVDRRRTRRWR